MIIHFVIISLLAHIGQIHFEITSTSFMINGSWLLTPVKDSPPGPIVSDLLGQGFEFPRLKAHVSSQADAPYSAIGEHLYKFECYKV